MLVMKNIILYSFILIVSCGNPLQKDTTNQNVTTSDVLGYWYQTQYVDVAYTYAGVPLDTTTRNRYVINDTVSLLMCFTADSIYGYQLQSNTYSKTAIYYSIYKGYLLLRIDSTYPGFDTLFPPLAGNTQQFMKMNIVNNNELLTEYKQHWDSPPQYDSCKYFYGRLSQNSLPSNFPNEPVVLH
jgi:hypothetical protein